MIVLDEQLLGRGLEQSIATCFPGAVAFILETNVYCYLQNAEKTTQIITQQ
jgi:hypothetical protein